MSKNEVAKFVIAAATLAVVGLGSQAAFAADATGTASVTIATPIAISQTTPLSFGTVVASGTAGTVVVSNASVRTTTGGVGALGGTPAAAVFNVTGQGTNAFSITLPTTVSLTGPGTAMNVTTFNHNAGASPALAAGAKTVNVGATLGVGANQTAGTYSGTYTVSVNYN